MDNDIFLRIQYAIDKLNYEKTGRFNDSNIDHDFTRTWSIKDRIYTERCTDYGNWELHNLNGPAIKTVDAEYFYIKGRAVSKEDFICLTSKLGKILYD